MPSCRHLDQLFDATVPPAGQGCAECLATRSTWVHLRRCLHCGHIGCCDSSKNKHATKHYHRSKHPVIQSFQPDESWKWCYVDEIMVE